MKLLCIWLVGVPLAVAGMCATAAFWPRSAVTTEVAARESPDRERQRDLQSVLAPVHR
jgi:hypothetical protein